jgi:4-hydroxybenzoate polyprenyltransferase and related prenyltransferases
MAVNNGQENGLYTYDSFGESRKPSDKKFLWWCAGAHQDLLKQFPSEHAKYSGLGGVLLATLVLASISAGYAVYTVFGSWLWTLAFAVIWGLIIFNFDRFLVSTMRKYGISKRKQLWMAMPRLALALLIGFTIARPLELKIFEKEINVKMTENLHKKIQRNDSLLTVENNNLMNSATAERQRLTERKLAIENELQNLQSSYVQEADGTGGSKQRGIEKLTHLKMDAYNKAKDQYAAEQPQLEQNIATQDRILANAKASMEQKRKDYEASAMANMGFLERNKALSDLSGEESSVFWSCLLVSMLIILIEIGPVLSKLIMPIGPYDIALAKEELLQMAADENHIRADKEVQHEKKRAFYQKQKEMSEQLVDKLTEIQKKNIDKELDQWERGEWKPQDHRASMDEVMRKIKEQYQVKDDGIL